MESDWRSVLLDAVKKVSNFVFADYMLVLNSGNKPLPSFPGPLYQNEVKCSAFDMEMIFHSHANITHFDTWPHFESEGFWNSEVAYSPL